MMRLSRSGVQWVVKFVLLLYSGGNHHHKPQPAHQHELEKVEADQVSIVLRRGKFRVSNIMFCISVAYSRTTERTNAYKLPE